MKREKAYWITVLLVVIVGGQTGRLLAALDPGPKGTIVALLAAISIGILANYLWNKSWPPEEGD